MYKLILENTSGSTVTDWGTNTATEDITANEIRVRYIRDTIGVNQTTTNGNLDIVLPGGVDGITSGTSHITLVSANIKTGIRFRAYIQAGIGWDLLYDSNDDTDKSQDIVRNGY